MPKFRFLIDRLVYFLPFLSTENVWEQSKIVEQYGARADLYYPEQIILDLLQNNAAKMKMLDLGVGAGRTTAHFAPLMNEYVGIDASRNMIKVCKKKFRKNKNLTFKVADAKNLNTFTGEEFDFVLFSFNGLDCMGHEDRLKTLMEIRQVMKANGYFCFSSHNLNWVWNYWVFKKGTLSSFFKDVRHLLLLRVYNRKHWKILRKQNKKNGHLIVTDGAHNFAVRNYHVTPTEQVKQLIAANFQEIKVYNLAGKCPDSSKIETEDDAWLYYVCKK